MFCDLELITVKVGSGANQIILPGNYGGLQLWGAQNMSKRQGLTRAAMMQISLSARVSSDPENSVHNRESKWQ
jgi:hypothetical protein